MYHAQAQLLNVGGSQCILVGKSNFGLLNLHEPRKFRRHRLGISQHNSTHNVTRNTTSETGSVSFNGTNDVITGSQVLTGAFQTPARSLSQLALTSATEVRVVFNAFKPGSAQSNITLTNLVPSIFSTAGATLFDSGAFAPVAFADTFTGAVTPVSSFAWMQRRLRRPSRPSPPVKTGSVCPPRQQWLRVA